MYRLGGWVVLAIGLSLLGCPSGPPEPGTQKFYRALDFTLTDADGVEHSLSDYTGDVVWLQFLRAADCEGCVPVADDSEAFYQERVDQGFTIITVLIGTDADAAQCATFRNSHGLTFPVLYNNSPDDAWGTYNDAGKIPLTLVLTREQVIWYKNIGYFPSNISNVIHAALQE